MFASFFFFFLFFSSFPLSSPLGLWLISLPRRKTLSLSIPSIQQLEFFDSCLQRPASIWSLFLPENFLPLGTNRWCLEWKAGRYKAVPFELTPLPNNWCFSIELRLHLYTIIMHMSLSNVQTQRWRWWFSLFSCCFKLLWKNYSDLFLLFHIVYIVIDWHDRLGVFSTLICYIICIAFTWLHLCVLDLAMLNMYILFNCENCVLHWQWPSNKATWTRSFSVKAVNLWQHERQWPLATGCGRGQ